MDPLINLVAEGGEVCARLRATSVEIVLEADELARSDNLTKRSALPRVVRKHVEASGFTIDDIGLEEACTLLDRVRRGERIPQIEVRVAEPKASTPDTGKIDGDARMKDINTPSGVLQFFERERVYPDKEARELYDRLMGLDEHKARLLVELELLLFPDRLAAWSKKQHGCVLHLCGVLGKRTPLILFQGDVGCGKTSLAETVGDALARQIGNGTKVHLLKMNTQVRGSGHVGEMSDLIVQAFVQAESRAAKLGQPVLLLIDEADALAAKRADQHMHHEDKAGLNTLLQRVDNLRSAKGRMAVIFVTNRPEALDQAVLRRAALRLTFDRPNDIAREEMFKSLVPELNLNSKQLKELVRLTGARPDGDRTIAFTASDITDRLLPAALRDAYSQKRTLSYDDLRAHAADLEPTSPMDRR